MLTSEQRKSIFDQEALREALRGTRVEDVAVIRQCFLTLNKDEFEAVLKDIIYKVYGENLLR